MVAVLVLGGSLHLVAICQLLLGIADLGEIRLEDILLIFNFVEIMTMANISDRGGPRYRY